MGRMDKFQEEMAKSMPMVPTVPGPTQQVIPELVSEVERLRSRVAEMEMERGARRKRSRSLSVPSPDFVGSPIWRCKHCTASTQDSTEGRSWRPYPHQSREHFGSEFHPVQPIGLRDLPSPARHARVQIYQGKTKIWNKGGFVPVGWEDLEAGARMMDPDATV